MQPPRLPCQAISCIAVADLRDYDAIDALFAKQKTKWDAVIHFAGLKVRQYRCNRPTLFAQAASEQAVGESSQIPLDYYENNITGTLNLLKAMRKVSTPPTSAAGNSCLACHTVRDAQPCVLVVCDRVWADQQCAHQGV